MRNFIVAFFLAVVMPLGGTEGFNSLSQLYWDGECQLSHFDGARATQIGLFYHGWVCYVKGDERWYEVDVEQRLEWELEAMNRQKEK